MAKGLDVEGPQEETTAKLQQSPQQATGTEHVHPERIKGIH